MNKLDQRTIELFNLVKNVVKQLNESECLFHARRVVEPLRTYVHPNCHVTSNDRGVELTNIEKVEWFAGQLLTIVDREAWHIMNRALNFFDVLEQEVTR